MAVLAVPQWDGGGGGGGVVMGGCRRATAHCTAGMMCDVGCTRKRARLRLKRVLLEV